MLHAVIMAGGSGTRFWPESRAGRPKQLLRLVGEKSMIQGTVARLGGAIPRERVLVVTNERLVEAIGRQLPELPPKAIIGEPCRRDTAPCIGLAAFRLLRTDPEATMVVMPSDHVITPEDVFQQSLLLAGQLVEADPAALVTFGIRPTYPAESFGYIERGATSPPPQAAAHGAPIYQVKRFREKPQAEVARQYIEQGTFYWNSGIFVWKARTILESLRVNAPQMFAHLERIEQAAGTAQEDEVFAREFAAIEGVSIDFAVMERAQRVLVIAAPFQWDDVGSWQSLSRLAGQDDDGNTIQAKHLGLRTTGTIVRSTDDDHLVVTLGLADCIVVHTADATLVASRHEEEAIRHLVKQIQERGMTEYL